MKQHKPYQFDGWGNTTQNETATDIGDLVSVIESQGYVNLQYRRVSDDGITADYYHRGSVMVEVVWDGDGRGGYRMGTSQGWCTGYLRHSPDTVKRLAYAQRTVNAQVKEEHHALQVKVKRWLLGKTAVAFGFYPMRDGYEYLHHESGLVLDTLSTNDGGLEFWLRQGGNMTTIQTPFDNIYDLTTILSTQTHILKPKGYIFDGEMIMTIIANYVEQLQALLIPHTDIDSCVLTSTVYQYLLPLFGIPAHTQVVRVWVHSPQAVAFYQAVEDGTRTEDEADQARDEGAVSVGVGYPPDPADMGGKSADGSRWNGHLIAYAFPKNGKPWIVDPTIPQANKRGVDVKPLVAEFDDVAMLYTGFSLGDERGNRLDYEVFPGETSYTDSPDFLDRGSTIRLASLLAEMIMSLGDGIHAQGIREVEMRQTKNGESSPR